MGYLSIKDEQSDKAYLTGNYKNQMKLLIILLIVLISSKNYSQVLHTESFNVIMDTTKRVKGSVVPNLLFQTQKKDLLEFENIADFSFRLSGNHAFTIGNKFALSKFGKETLLSGGYVYVEYRNIMEKKIVIEPFSQVHWAESRGMEFKYAGGINIRYKILIKNKIGIYLGAGPFYELERWNYDGVSAQKELPEDLSNVRQGNIKMGSYLSFKIKPFEEFAFDFSVYHQSRFDEIFSTPRLASSTELTWEFTEYLGFSLIYQNIFDYAPIVPIKKDFHKIISGISVNF